MELWVFGLSLSGGLRMSGPEWLAIGVHVVVAEILVYFLP